MAALWYPFAPPGAAPTLKLIRGEGSYVYDINGRSYLNATSSLWNVALGQGNTEVLSRMEAQLRTMAYGPLFDAGHWPAEMLARRLVDLAGGEMCLVYLSLSGTSANEAALRVARQYHRVMRQPERRLILSFDRSYHGCSWMNMSASGLERAELWRWDEVMPDFKCIPSPDDPSSLEYLEVILDREGGRVACIIVEPILGSAGIVVPPKGYFESLTTLCRSHGVLIVADEVATGGGRCGEWLVSGLLGLDPDIVTLSKGITSGYAPLGATIFRRSVVEPLQNAGAPILFGSTQDGNPVACAAALATLEYIEQKNLLERARNLGNWVISELQLLCGNTVISEVRGLGLMIGIDLMHVGLGGRPFTVQEISYVRQRCQEEGLLVYHFDSGLSLFPPMTLSDDEGSDLVDILRIVLTNLS